MDWKLPHKLEYDDGVFHDIHGNHSCSGLLHRWFTSLLCSATQFLASPGCMHYCILTFSKLI